MVRRLDKGSEDVADVVLRAEDVTFAYPGGEPVLRGARAEIRAGCVTGVIGPNGAGKSTLLRVLAGLLRPAAGRVELLDGRGRARGLGGVGSRELAMRLAYLSQRPTVAFAFTVRQVVRLGLYARRGAESGADGVVERALENVGAVDLIDRPFGALSVGQQQRVTLARALAQLDGGGRERGREVLLADEPVSAMDPKHAAHAMGVLAGLARSGMGVVVVLHDLTLAARTLDRVIALDGDGRVIAEGATREALTPELLQTLFDWPFRWVDGDGVGGGGVLVPMEAAGV